jgi:hypothetical protein
MPAKGWDANRPPGGDPAGGGMAPPTGSGPVVTAPGAPTASAPTVAPTVASDRIASDRTYETTVVVGDTAVVEVKEKKRRKKKKYSSKSARDFQQAGNAFSKGAFRLANAVAVGLDTFHRSQNRSAKKKRDGMLKDGMLNTAKGFRDAGQEAARAPYDIYNRVNVWRQARRAMKMFVDPMGMFPKVK